MLEILSRVFFKGNVQKLYQMYLLFGSIKQRCSQGNVCYKVSLTLPLGLLEYGF